MKDVSAVVGTTLGEDAALGVQTRRYMTNTLLSKTSERTVEGITMFVSTWQYASEDSP